MFSCPQNVKSRVKYYGEEFCTKHSCLSATLNHILTFVASFHSTKRGGTAEQNCFSVGYKIKVEQDISE